MDKHVVIVGGGVAGLEAGCRLAESGCNVSIYEKNATGGHVNDWFRLFPDRKDSTNVLEYLRRSVTESGVRIFTGVTIEKIRESNSQFRLQTSSGEEIHAHAVVVATGFDLFRSERKEEYGYGIYDNVITSSDLESMFRRNAVLTCDGRIPERIGIVHCVGSRDEKAGNLYCSKLCCVTAVKQAIEIVEQKRDARVFCFYMDMRMGGAHYEELYREAQEKWGVSFIRGKVSEVSESITNKLIIKVEDTLLGRPLKMELDLLVLMAGMEMSESGKKLAVLSGLKTGENKFFETADHHFGSNRSNLEGIYFAGSCTMPMNITETISHARAVVPEVIAFLKKRSG